VVDNESLISLLSTPHYHPTRADSRHTTYPVIEVALTSPCSLLIDRIESKWVSYETKVCVLDFSRFSYHMFWFIHIGRRMGPGSGSGCFCASLIPSLAVFSEDPGYGIMRPVKGLLLFCAHAHEAFFFLGLLLLVVVVVVVVG